MKLLVTTLFAICVSGSAAAQQAETRIDSALVKKFESQMIMPKGASALSAYSRFYTLSEIGGRRFVRGVYLKSLAPYYRDRAEPVDGVPGAFVMKADADLPIIMDGGCSIVEMAFDIATQTLVLHRFTDRQPSLPDAAEPTGYCHGRA